MRAIRNLVLFILTGTLLFLLFGWYSGFFAHARLEVKTIGEFMAVYEDHLGAYSKTTGIQEKLADRLWDDGVDNYKNFGIYYDNPETVETGDLHSIAGRVIYHDHEHKIRRLSGEYNIYNFEKQKAAMVELPVKNIFSLYAAIYKAYPLLDEYAANHHLDARPIIEIYDNPGKVQFILPLE